MLNQNDRFSQQESVKVFRVAAKLYSDYCDEISFGDLIQSGRDANIPLQFMEQAVKIVAQRKEQQKWIFPSFVFFAGCVLFGAMFAAIRALTCVACEPNPTAEVVLPAPAPSVSAPAPALYVPPVNEYTVWDIDFVRRSHSDISQFENKFDYNLVARTVVYQTGNSGHVTTLYCIFSPDTDFSLVRKVYFYPGEYEGDFIGFSSSGKAIYYCR
jgi:hypothetical protein